VAKWLKSKYFTANLSLKLVSLFLAVVIWLYASGEERVEVTRKIPIRFEPPSSAMTVLDSSLKSIKVTMRVPRNLLSIVSSSDLKAYHKIKGADTAGEYAFMVSRKDFKLPPGNIQITKMEPEVVHVVLDELITVKLTISPNFSGEPAIGYGIDEENIKLDPNAAMIEGPKSKLELMSSVLTEPIDLVGRTRSFWKKVGLMLDPDIKSVITSFSVSLYVPMKEEFSDIDIPDIKISILSPQDKLYKVTLDPTTVTVSLKGPLASLDGLEAGAILAYVDIAGLKKGKHSLPLKTKLPSGVSLKGEPPLIGVKIEEVER